MAPSGSSGRNVFQGNNPGVGRDACTGVSTAALSTVCPSAKPPACPTAGRVGDDLVLGGARAVGAEKHSAAGRSARMWDTRSETPVHVVRPWRVTNIPMSLGGKGFTNNFFLCSFNVFQVFYKKHALTL